MKYRSKVVRYCLSLLTGTAALIGVQKTVAELAKTAIDYPPMQAPASFNLEAVKQQVEDIIKSHEGE